ncbi:MAG: hypothetical protein FWH35_02140 [Treponema sp.]|nr:hypothetical protein [Treponema sp.]
MKKSEEIKKLENGNGIQYLLNTAYKILGNPIFMIDANYNLIAITDVPVDDPNWNELVTTGTFSQETMEILANEGLIEEITNAEKVAILRSDKLKYAKITGHVFNRDNIRVGLVMMSECSIPFDAENTAAFEALADKITSEIRNYDYFTMLAMTYHEDKINLLLDGAVKNPLLYNPQAQILYDDFEDYLYVAVVSLERNNILEHIHRSRLEYFKSMLKTKYKMFKYSVYADHIVVLMSSKNKNSYGVPFFSAHANLFEQNGLSMGISSSFENIYELRIYYDQAVAALKNGLAGKEDKHIFLSTDS